MGWNQQLMLPEAESGVEYTTLYDGAIECWLMDESGTGTRYGFLGNLDFESENNVPSVAGKFDNAAEPESVDYEQDLAILDDGHQLGSNTHEMLTIAAWSKIDDLNASDTVYILVRDNGSIRDYFVQYNRFTAELTIFGLWNGSFIAASVASGITAGEWFSWAIQIDPTEKKVRIRSKGGSWSSWSTAGNATAVTAAPVFIFCRGDQVAHTVHTQDFVLAMSREITESEYLDIIWNGGDGPASGNPLVA